MKEERAYRIMVSFLQARQKEMPSDVLAILLSELNLNFWDDGLPADPAITEEWDQAIARADEDAASVLRKAS